MTSSGSARLKARRSATCSPCGSITVSLWPLSRVNATPERGGISCRTRILAARVERADPGFVDGASAVLARLRRLAVDGQHRVRRARVAHVPFDDPLPKLVVAPLRPKLLELVVEVEHQRGRLEAAGLAARVRMQAHHEEAFPA